MLLAEALAARKDALKQIEDLRERIAAAAVRYEDQAAPIEDLERGVLADGRRVSRQPRPPLPHRMRSPSLPSARASPSPEGRVARCGAPSRVGGA